MGQIIGTIIFGAVIGILARLVLPGKQQYGMIVTVVLGIAGALIGYWVWGAISDKGDTVESTGSAGSSASPRRPCSRSATAPSRARNSKPTQFEKCALPKFGRAHFFLFALVVRPQL